MGSLASGIFGLVEGDPAAAQENQLNALSGYQTGVGENLTTAGAGFEEGILSGDPTRIATALAPEISTGQNQVKQAAKTNAEFGNRSGGTAASTAGAESAERGNIINLEGGLQKGAASTALSSGSGLLSGASGNINDVAGLKTAQQQREQSDVGQVAKGAAEIAAAPFTGGASLGMGDLSMPGGGRMPDSPGFTSPVDPIGPTEWGGSGESGDIFGGY